MQASTNSTRTDFTAQPQALMLLYPTAAHVIDFSRSRIFAAAASGELPSFIAGGRRMVRRDDLMVFAERLARGEVHFAKTKKEARDE